MKLFAFWFTTCVLTMGSNVAVAFLLETVPPGLLPGETYQLAFVTSKSRDFGSDNIEDYNDFVQEVADLKWLGDGSVLDGVTWKAIVSTPASAPTLGDLDNTDPIELPCGPGNLCEFRANDARVNAEVLAPVYDLSGDLVAENDDDLWDGTLLSVIDTLETGISYESYLSSFFSGFFDTPLDRREVGVWTGTDDYGRNAWASPSASLLGGYEDCGFVTAGLIEDCAVFGEPTYTDNVFTDYWSIDRLAERQFYALSEVLTVCCEPPPPGPPAGPISAVPTPASLALVGLGLAVLGISHRKRNTQR